MKYEYTGKWKFIYYFLLESCSRWLHFTLPSICETNINSCISTSNNIMRTTIVAFKPRKTSFLPCFWFFNYCWLYLLLLLRILSGKYINCKLFLYLQRSKTLLLHYHRHFNVWKHQRYLPCCFLVPKTVPSTVFLHFNF